MSDYVTDEMAEAAAREATDFAPADQCAHHGGCDCVHQHAALRIGTRFLRAYQAPREWTIPELEALHPEALLVDRDNRPIPDLPAQLWLRDGADLGPLRLVYNPNDMKEN